MKPKSALRSFLFLAGSSLLAISSASAQLTWDANNTGAGQTNGAGAWLGTNQWWDGAANVNWVSGSDAIFGGANTAGGAVTLASPTMVESFTFNQFTGTYTLGTSGQLITLNSGITKNASSAAVTFVGPITLDGAQTWTNNSTGTLTTATGTNLITNGGFDLTVDGTGNTTFGVINNDATSLTGSGALVKNGTGVLTLGGVNAGFTGNVTVNGGVLRVTKPTSITGNLNLTGGVYEHYWNDAYTRTLGTGAGQIQITGGVSGFSENGATGVTFTINNSAAYELVWGALNEAGNANSTGLFNPSTFVLQADTAQATSSLTLANKLDLNGSTRTIQVSGGTTGGARATISGQIRTSTGTAGITKTGAGYLALSNASNAWNGATTVNGGILDLTGITNANLSGGSGRNVTVAAGAAVRFNALSNTYLNRIVETTDEIGVMSGGTANSFDFSSGTGATLPNAFLGNWAGNGAKAEMSGTITPGSDGYKFGAKGSSGNLGIRGAVTGANTLTVGQTGASGVRVTLAGAKNFTGQTVINSGAKLTLGDNLALQNSALNVGSAGGNIAFNGGTAAATITGNTVASSPTFGGLIGSRNLSSVFTTSAGNNESNLTANLVTGFTLNVANGNTFTYSGNIGGFGTGTSNNAGGGINGNSTLTKTGDGIQILTGVHTYTGATTISGGTLDLGTTGSIAASTSMVLGAAGTLNTSSQTANYAIPASQPVTFGIDSTGSGSSGKIVADELDVSNATVTYDIPVALDDAVYVLATYTAGNLTGTFLSAPAAPSGYSLDYAYQGNKIALVSGGGPTGFAAWQSANSTGGTLADDHDGDGVHNGTEYFLGGTANTTGFTALPGVTNTGGILSVTFTKAGGYTGTYGTDFVVETSSTLVGPWTTETLGVNVIITGNDVKYTFPAGTLNFARLRVTGP